MAAARSGEAKMIWWADDFKEIWEQGLECVPRKRTGTGGRMAEEGMGARVKVRRGGEDERDRQERKG